MAKLFVQAQATSNRSEYVFVQDSASTTGGGKTGIAYNAAGLTAYYVRPAGSATAITLATQTVTGAWSSGGWVEVDATNLPGIYRFDIPNAVFATGVDHAVVMLKGASGMASVSLEYQLTGFDPATAWLTSTQTAAAVWGASNAGYTGATTFGGVLNEDHQLAVSTDATVNQIPNLVWDELRSIHTTVGSFGEYVNTNINTGAIADAIWDEPKSGHTTAGTYGDYLDTKVSTVADTARIQLRQGPFLIKQNATEGLITEVNQFLSTVPNMEMVLIDSSGGSVSVSGSTLVLRVRNQAGTAVVNNVTPTVAYADGGVIRWTPNQSWTALGVTTAGTYRIIVERTMGTTTTTFGPFLVQLSSG